MPLASTDTQLIPSTNSLLPTSKELSTNTLDSAEPESRAEKIKRIRAAGDMFGASSATKPALTLSLGGGGGSSTPAGGSLFGAQPQQQSSSLFGASTQQQPLPALGSSLFGGQAAQQQQPATGGGLFGSTLQNGGGGAGGGGGGLFGGQQPSQQQQRTSLFANLNQPQQPQQQQSSSLFGSFGQSQQQQQQNNSLFGQSNNALSQQQQQQQPNNLSTSLFGSLGMSQQHQSGSPWQQSQLAPREKPIPEQILTILEKWNPESANCSLQHYFYNAVRPEQVMYFGPAPGEDGARWEEALRKKPAEGSIPVLARGFKAVGARLNTSNVAVNQLQARMHEINDSLTALMQNHDLTVSVRTAEARRRHVALSQRCLGLATKVQVLRSRGYALDEAEEGLKMKLVELERRAYDPVLGGRQEEVWARLSDLRDRAVLLREEVEKIGVVGGAGGRDDGPWDDDMMATIRKLLDGFDGQLGQLKDELEAAKKAFEEWERERSVLGKGKGR